MQSETQLYIPIGVRTENELFTCFGKRELLQSVIGSLFGGGIAALLWLVTGNVAITVDCFIIVYFIKLVKQEVYLKFIDLFAGIGGFRHGLERSGHKCVGHVEIDSFANKSYMAMYELVYCKFEKSINDTSCMMCSMEVNKNCDGEQCNGEWYAKDIKQITAEEVPQAEIWTFGFPCTDISLSGKRAGLHGERSGLFFEVGRLLEGQSAENKPRWIIVENVKHLLSIDGGGAFTTVLCELSKIGYDLQWQVHNSKAFGVPQHKERVYIAGHLRGTSGGEVFLIYGINTINEIY